MGSELPKHPELMKAILTTLVQNMSLPITCKVVNTSVNVAPLLDLVVVKCPDFLLTYLLKKSLS